MSETRAAADSGSGTTKGGEAGAGALGRSEVSERAEAMSDGESEPIGSCDAKPAAGGESKPAGAPGGFVVRLSQQTGAELDAYLESILALPPVEPWPEPVNGAELLEALRQKIMSHVVLPRWAAETMALWVPHTFAFGYRDITTYLG